MLLNDILRSELYAHFGLDAQNKTEAHPQSDLAHSAAQYGALIDRTRALLGDAGLARSPLHVVYAALPALASAATEGHQADAEMSGWVDEFLAGYRESALPFYLINIAIKCLEKRLFGREAIPAPTLDLGIGDGYASDFIFRPSRPTVGSEPSLVAIIQAAARRRHEHYCAVDMTRIPFKDETFSAITAVHSIDHVGDRMPVLKEMARVLRPGGRLILSDASAHIEELMPLAQIYRLMGYERLGANAFNYFLDFGGERVEFYTPERYERVLSELEFEDVRVEYFTAPEVARLSYLQFELQLVLLGLGHHDEYLRSAEGAPLREFFFDCVRRAVVPLLSHDAELCRQAGRGLNLFVTAKKRGESRGEPPAVMERTVCTECRVNLEGYMCSSCGRVYPVVDSLPLLVPTYADAWAEIKDRLPARRKEIGLVARARNSLRWRLLGRSS